jgi:AP-3 complex subunit delta
MERQRDDPYYISDRASGSRAPPNGHDVDSIPVVRLDDLPSPSAAPVAALASVLREPTARSPASTFVVDRVGEMPRNAISPAVPSPSVFATPFGSSTPARTGTPTLSSGFAEYVVDDTDERVSAPAPIKVTRAKKKGGTSGKTKRTKAKEQAAAGEAEPEY